MENIIKPHTNKAEANKVSNNLVPELTVKSLGEMLIAYIDTINDSNEQQDKRLLVVKRQLINFLFNGIGRKSKDCLEQDGMFNPLKEDDNLILYTFYIAHNQQFNFHWSYLLQKINKLENFIKTFNMYINFVCSDISKFIQILPVTDNTTFIVDEYLTIIYCPHHNKIEARIELDNIQKIIQCKKDFYKLKISSNAKTIISLSRSAKESIETSINRINILMKINQ